MTWDRELDVVVVGFGAAGSAAALDARREGAEVLVIDRFAGGGATAPFEPCTLPGRSTAATRYCSGSSPKVTVATMGKKHQLS